MSVGLDLKKSLRYLRVSWLITLIVMVNLYIYITDPKLIPEVIRAPLLFEFLLYFISFLSVLFAMIAGEIQMALIAGEEIYKIECPECGEKMKKLKYSDTVYKCENKNCDTRYMTTYEGRSG